MLKQEKKNTRINVRITEKEYKKIKRKAMLYAEGNISAYLIYCGINFVPHKSEIKKRG